MILYLGLPPFLLLSPPTPSPLSFPLPLFPLHLPSPFSLSQLPNIKVKMLLSVTSRSGISTFGYNKNNKKVGKSDFFGIQLLPFLGIGSVLGFNILLKRGTRFLSSLWSLSASLFHHFFFSFFFFGFFSHLVLKFQEFIVPYVRPEKAGELKTN